MCVCVCWWCIHGSVWKWYCSAAKPIDLHGTVFCILHVYKKFISTRLSCSGTLNASLDKRRNRQLYNNNCQFFVLLLLAASKSNKKCNWACNSIHRFADVVEHKNHYLNKQNKIEKQHPIHGQKIQDNQIGPFKACTAVWIYQTHNKTTTKPNVQAIFFLQTIFSFRWKNNIDLNIYVENCLTRKWIKWTVPFEVATNSPWIKETTNFRREMGNGNKKWNWQYK